MVWPLIAGGAQVVSGIASYQSQSAQAKNDNRRIAHQMQVDAENNKRAVAAGDRQQVTVTRNQRRAFENAVVDIGTIEEGKLKAQASARVNAAASGTAGGSVDAQIREIQRTASQAEFGAVQRATDISDNLERQRVEIQAAVEGRTTENMYSFNDGPNAFLSALGTGLSAATSYATINAGF